MANYMKYKGIKCRECSNEAPHCSCKPFQWSWGGYPIQLQERWGGTHKKRKPTRQQIEVAADLYRLGYRQLSRKYREIQVLKGNDWCGKKIKLSEGELKAMRRIEATMSRIEYMRKTNKMRQQTVDRLVSAD